MKAQRTKDVLAHLRAIGWVRLRAGRGSHELSGLPDESVKHTIPVGHREVSAGVLHQIKSKGVPIPRQWR